MAQSGQRKCLCCGLFFDPDPRNRERQRYCSAADCRRASKAASQAVWLNRPDNVGYFRGAVHSRSRAGLARRSSRLWPRQAPHGACVTRFLDHASACFD